MTVASSPSSSTRTGQATASSGSCSRRPSCPPPPPRTASWRGSPAPPSTRAPRPRRVRRGCSSCSSCRRRRPDGARVAGVEGANGFLRVDGRLAIVTGGAQGIGLASARRLVGAGATVAVWDRDSEAAAEAVRALRADGEADAYHVDVRDPRSIDRALQVTLAPGESADILVNYSSLAVTPATLPAH